MRKVGRLSLSGRSPGLGNIYRSWWRMNSGIGVEPVGADHGLALVGDMRCHPGDEFQVVHPLELGAVVAFTPYAPLDAEIEKMKRKVDAGASFIITQPIIGRDDRLDGLAPFRLPVTLDAWMSKKLRLLSECVGHKIPEGTPYDPMENLRELRRNYPDYGLYLAILGFKTPPGALGVGLCAASRTTFSSADAWTWALVAVCAEGLCAYPVRLKRPTQPLQRALMPISSSWIDASPLEGIRSPLRAGVDGRGPGYSTGS